MAGIRTQGVSHRGRKTGRRPNAEIRSLKAAFLQAFAHTGAILKTCENIGVSRNTVVGWRETDPDFAQSFVEAEQRVVERLEGEAMRRAVEGIERIDRRYWHGELVAEDIRRDYSDNLLVALLRARDPGRFRDQSQITINQVIKTVTGFNPSEVLGLLAAADKEPGLVPALPPPNEDTDGSISQ